MISIKRERIPLMNHFDTPTPQFFMNHLANNCLWIPNAKRLFTTVTDRFPAIAQIQLCHTSFTAC